MIIECPKCGTKYRFDQDKVTGEGIWVRCKQCRNVFFQKSPPDQDVNAVQDRSPVTPVPPPDIKPVETDGPGMGELENLWKEADRDRTEVAHESSGRHDEEDDFIDEEVGPAIRPRKSLWTTGKIIIYVIVLIVVLGGVYLSVFPDVSRQLISLTPVAKFFGIEMAADAPVGTGIDLLNVRERFVENRMVGNLMVIEGYAVNRNGQPISKVKVRAKLLDSAGDSVGESEAYCGDLLSEEELSNLTEKEIRAELINPLGKKVPNANIVSNGNIPFMIIFFNSPQRAAEYIVEVAEMEKSLK